MKKNKNKVILVFLIAALVLSSYNYILTAKTYSNQELSESLMEEIKNTLINRSPDLTDEIYTGIMFLRFDAEKYYEKGEYVKCLEVLEVIVRLINIDNSINLAFPKIY